MNPAKLGRSRETILTGIVLRKTPWFCRGCVGSGKLAPSRFHLGVLMQEARAAGSQDRGTKSMKPVSRLLFATLFRANFFTLIRELIGVGQLGVTTDSQRPMVLSIDCLEKTIRVGFGERVIGFAAGRSSL